MSEKVFLETETMMNKANEIRRFRAEYERIISKVGNLIESLSDTWRGDSQTTLYQTYKETGPVIREFNNSLERYAKAVEETVKNIQEKDSSDSAFFKKLI